MPYIYQEVMTMLSLIYLGKRPIIMYCLSNLLKINY